MIKSLFIFIFLLIINTLDSQNYFGLYQSNYSGSLGIHTNPSSFVNNKIKWDLNLAGFGALIHSDYVYIKDESLISLAKKENLLGAYDSIPSNYEPNKDALYTFENPTSNYNAGLVSSVFYGPSLSFRIKDISLGIFTKVTAAGNVFDIPNNLSYYYLKNIENFQRINIDQFSACGMGWGEIGFNFAKKLNLENENVISFGANIKYLMGYEAVYAQNNTLIDFTKLPDSINMHLSNTEIGFSTGKSTNSNDYNFNMNGSGVGVDLGIEYIIPEQSDLIDDSEDENPPFTDYKLKIGSSITDFGMINFNQNTQVHIYDINIDTKLKEGFNKNSKQIDDLFRSASYQIYSDSNKSKIGDNFKIYTPLSLNLYVDYKILKNIYINTSIKRRIKLENQQVLSTNYMAVVPRIETRWFEFGIPLTLLEDKYLGVGSYVRLGFLTLGTNYMNSTFFKQNKLKNFDFYMAFKLNPIKFKKGDKDEKYSNFGSSTNKKTFGCFKFK